MGDFMKLYITLSKRHLAVILAALIIGIILAGQFLSAESGKIDGATNAKRVQFLSGRGIEIDDRDVSSKEIIIPQKFSKVYESYNSLQKKAGFDLSDYKGKKATVYTYRISGDNSRQAHLIVLGGQIIGGDVAEVKLGGEIKPIK